MADSTVAPSGGDFTTLAAALSDAGTGAGDTITIQGDWTSATDTTEAAVEDDNITIVVSSTGGARHAGFYNGTTNHELNTSGNSHSLQIDNTGCTVDGLVIVQSGTGKSDEVCRLEVDGTLTVVDTILRCNSNSEDQDCLYCGQFTSTINCENVIAIGAGRAGFQAQLSSAGAADTQTWNLISCTAWNNGRFSGENDGGGVSAQARNASSVTNINCFNCIFVGNTSASSEDYQNATGTNNGTRNWALDRCGEDSTRTTITTLDSGAVGAISFETVTDGALGAANDQVGFQDITTAPYDLRLQDDANNDAQDVHTDSTGAGLTFGDYVGSSVDIAGTTRPVNTNYDLGAFEVAAAAGNEETLAATMAGVALFDILVGKTVAATVVSTSVFQRDITKTLTATQTGVPAFTKRISKTLAATMVGVANLVRFAATSVTMAATQIGIPLFARQVGKGLSSAASPASAFKRDVSKTITSTAVPAPKITKQASKTLTAVMVGTANLSATLVFLINLVATMTGVAFILKRVGVGLPATATLTPAIRRQVGKSLRATATAVGAFQIHVGKILRATQTGVADLVASAGNTVLMAATMIGVPKIAKQMSKTLSATMTAVMTIRKAVALTLRATATLIATIGTTGPGAVVEEERRIWYKGLFSGLGKMRK